METHTRWAKGIGNNIFLERAFNGNSKESIDLTHIQSNANLQSSKPDRHTPSEKAIIITPNQHGAL